MQSLAQDVGGLKRALTNVKTRGVLGEAQLGALLEQFLAPGQQSYTARDVVESLLSLTGKTAVAESAPVAERVLANA